MVHTHFQIQKGIVFFFTIGFSALKKYKFMKFLKNASGCLNLKASPRMLLKEGTLGDEKYILKLQAHSSGCHLF